MDRFPFELDHRICRPHLTELTQLFDDMDAAYDKIADFYGFHCTGCEDSCCRSRFYHHTLLEYLYLSVGLMELSSAQRNDILDKANRLKTGGDDDRPMCPVNLEGRCRLYRFRPMICRLHGVAHEFIGPDNTVRSGPGCDKFTLHSDNHLGARFDRTPMYRRMALLEKKLRERIRFKGRIRLTVAQMIIYASSATYFQDIIDTHDGISR